MPENNNDPNIRWEAIININNRPIEDIYPEVTWLKGQINKDIKEIKKEIILLEGDIVKQEDAIYIPNIGYFRKDDIRIKKDYCTYDYLIIDKKYTSEHSYVKIYTDLDNEGNFINPEYTKMLPIDELLIRIKGENIYAISSLIDNNIFNKYYHEDMFTGTFFQKTKKIQPFIKNNKIAGSKTKGTLKFKDFILNKPITYRGTFNKRYFFGCEVETCSGMLPNYLSHKICYSSVRDGSLRHADDGLEWGVEYVTDLLYGDLGLYQLKLLCNELTKRCLVDKTAGVHIHVGNVDFTKETIVLMYHIYSMIQDEVFELLPKSRRDNEYCRKLKKLPININNIKGDRDFYINKYYNDIVTYLANQPLSTKVNKKTDHPKGFKCGYDHSTARYCWVNFIPAIFDTRKTGSYSIEFRPMSGTTSYYKIKCWLMTCFALVDICENHKQEIYNREHISLIDIINICYPNNSNNLINWIEKRKNKFMDKENTDHKMIEDAEYLDNDFDETLSLKNL